MNEVIIFLQNWITMQIRDVLIVEKPKIYKTLSLNSLLANITLSSNCLPEVLFVRILNNIFVNTQTFFHVYETYLTFIVIKCLVLTPLFEFAIVEFYNLTTRMKKPKFCEIRILSNSIHTVCRGVFLMKVVI